MRRALVLTCSVLAVLLVQAGGASGRASYHEWLVLKEVGLDGSKRVLSRHNAAPEISSLSPDGRLVAYAPYVYDGTRSKELWIANAQRRGERLLIRMSGWIYDFAWALDNRTIALSVAAPDEGIWLIESDGTGLHRIADVGFGIAWSPDQRRLLYDRFIDGRLVIAVLDLGSGSTRELDEGQSAVWSPHGSAFAYEHVLGCDCPPEIRVMSVDTGLSHRLVRGVSPVWSPDGARIAYTRTRVGEPDSLWTVRAQGGKPRFLANRARSGVWSPDGRWIAFTRLVQGMGYCKTRLFVASSHGRGTRRLAEETRQITPERWTRKGRLQYSAPKCSL